MFNFFKKNTKQLEQEIKENVVKELQRKIILELTLLRKQAHVQFYFKDVKLIQEIEGIIHNTLENYINDTN